MRKAEAKVYVDPDHVTLFNVASEFYKKAPTDWQKADKATQLKYYRIRNIMFRCKLATSLTTSQKVKQQERDERVQKRLSKRTQIAMVAVQFKERIKQLSQMEFLVPNTIYFVTHDEIREFKYKMPLGTEGHFWKHMLKYGLKRDAVNTQYNLVRISWRQTHLSVRVLDK